MEKISVLKNKYSIDFLKKNIFLFRDYVTDPEYHFKIGLSLLNMGYLKEAYIAFEYAYKKENNQRYLLLQLVTLTQAQKYDESIKLIPSFNTKEMKLNELVVFMETRNRLSISNKELIPYLNRSNSNIDEKVLLTFAYLLCNEESKANDLLNDISYKEFSSISEYMQVIEDLYKLKLSKDILLNIFNKIPLDIISEDDVLFFLKTITSSKIFFFMNEDKKYEMMKYFIDKFNNNYEILSFVYSTLFDLTKDDKYINLLKDILKEKLIEQALLTVVVYEFNHFSNTDHLYLKEKLEDLISIDQKNMLYRKYYFEFLKQLGFINQSIEVCKSSILLKQKEEEEIFKIIKTFHHFYINESCPFCLNEKDNCLFCNGSKNSPIIKTIAFNTTPSEIFADNISSKKIELDENSLSKLLEWNSMNVASPLVGEYFKKLGAYSTQNPFPSVLVEGQTYVFIKLKENSLKRLATEGYSLEQIDPLLNILAKYQRMDLTTKFNTVNKLIDKNNLPINSSDLVIEIIQAIKK